MSELAAKVAIIERSADAINRKDLDDLTACCTPDVEFHSATAAAEGVVYRGVKGLENYLADRAEAWSSFRLEIEDVIDAGPERAVMLARVRATGRASGIPVDQPLAGLITFAGGLVAINRIYLDRDEALRAAGLAR